MAKLSISARTANGWINDMDVTKSWIETEMDGHRGPGGYLSVIEIRCIVCSVILTLSRPYVYSYTWQPSGKLVLCCIFH